MPSEFRHSCAPYYVFSSEFLLLLLLTRVCTGHNLTFLARHVFGGGAARLCVGLDIITDYLFVKFFHKISGSSLEDWVDQVDDFRKVIHTRLTRPRKQADKWLLQQATMQYRRVYLIDTPFCTFCPWCMINDTEIRTTRLVARQQEAKIGAPRKKGAHVP